MLVPLARSVILVVCAGCSLAVLGRAPGAVNLRTRDLETELAAESRHVRETRERAALYPHAPV